MVDDVNLKQSILYIRIFVKNFKKNYELIETNGVEADISRTVWLFQGFFQVNDSRYREQLVIEF